MSLGISRERGPGQPSARSSCERFVAAAVVHFEETGEWPKVPDVQRRLTKWLEWADARKEAKRLPASLGRIDAKDRVIVAVRGIYLVDPASRMLDDFQAAVLLATDCYRNDRSIEATLSRSQLAAELGDDELRSRRTTALLEAESLIEPGPPVEGESVITQEIWRFLPARLITDYVRIKAEADEPRGLARLRRIPAGVAGWLFGQGTRVWEKLLVGVLIFLIGTMLVAVLAWGVRELTSSGGDGGTGQRPGKVEAGLRPKKKDRH